MSPPSGIKLRDSCESCAASKVRCSKEKPTCDRCAERGIRCQYSVKQKIGRRFRRRDQTNDDADDATSSQASTPLAATLGQTIAPLSSAAPFFPELATASGLPLLDSPFGALDASANLIAGFDDFKTSPSTIDTLSLPITPYQAIQSQPGVVTDQAQRYSAGNSLNEVDTSLQSCESLFLSAPGGSRGSLSAPGKVCPDGEELGLAPPACNLPTAQPSPQPGTARDFTGSPQPDSLETALRLMRQLSCGQDHTLLAGLAATGQDHRATEPLPLQVVIDKNKKAMESVRSTLQTARSQDGYLLVVVCLVVSKVLTTYASAVPAKCARENDRRRSSAPTLYTSSEDKDPLAAQRVLDELYQVQALMDQLGAKMQEWARQNQAHSGEAFPIGNDTGHATPAGFPFSATVLNQIYTELRKRLSTLSLGLVDEIKRYWT